MGQIVCLHIYRSQLSFSTYVFALSRSTHTARLLPTETETKVVKTFGQGWARGEIENETNGIVHIRSNDRSQRDVW
jgi:hypothetical protein